MPENEKMTRIFSIQSLVAWNEFLRRGEISCDGTRIDEDFRVQYDWMRAQMAKRLPSYGGRYPIWGWVHPAVDLRADRYRNYEPSALIVADVPAERVLVSDYMVWHLPLNYGYISWSEEEDDRVCPRRGQNGRWLHWEDLSGDQKQCITDSWERVFDLASIRQSPWLHGDTPDRQYLQACVERIDFSEVKKVVLFNLPGRSRAMRLSRRQVQEVVRRHREQDRGEEGATHERFRVPV